MSRARRWLMYAEVLTLLFAFVALPVSAAVSVQDVFDFTAYASGTRPTSPLLQGLDGALYGTTASGGTSGYGTVFKVNPDGTGYTTLHTFTTVGVDGLTPYAGLVQGSDGTLYGTTYAGSSSSGTVFKIMPDGTGFAVLHSFRGSDGSSLLGGVIIGSGGVLFGTTYFGGTSHLGTLFKLNPDGTNFAVLHSFTTNGNGGIFPRSSLCRASDGVLYGTTEQGGASGFGTVFKINPNGTGYSVLHSFSGVNDGHPNASMIQAAFSVLYGTTRDGSIFKINTDGTGYAAFSNFNLFFQRAPLVQASDGDLYLPTGFGVYKIHTNLTGFTSLHSFTGGDASIAGLIQCSDGSLYGTAQYGGTANMGGLFKLKTDGTNYSLFYPFSSAGGSGYAPQSQLTFGSDGKLYGATQNGGDGDAGSFFKVNPDGTGYTQLYSFSNFYFSANPSALTLCSDGALYGVAAGGANGDGALFKIDASGTTVTTVYSFNYIGNAGYSPIKAVIEGLDGALYGVNYSGGLFGGGTVYKIAKDGTGYVDIHSFGSAGDGSTPFSSLIQTSDGSLYGTTNQGGASGNGTVFKLNSDGTNYSVLHSFGVAAGDGLSPNGIIKGSDGAIYGTTGSGGANFGGTVFKINQDGSGYTSILSTPNYSLGVSPTVLQGPDGALYGTFGYGGTQYAGSIFKVNSDGSGYSEIYSFNQGDTIGYYLYSGLVKGSDDALYGVATLGGANGAGSIFKVLGYADQSIAFGPLADQTLGAAPLSLSATASSGLPVSFAVTAGPATLNGTTLTLTGTGSVTVQATQVGNTIYGAAAPVSQTFTVNPLPPAIQTLSFPPIADQTYGVAPLTLNATASSGLPVTFAIMSGPASLNANTLTITGVGSITVQATQTGNANFAPATPVAQTFSVNPAQAIVTLSDLYATFDGTPKSVTCATTPAGLAVNITYNGSTTPPVSEGTYLVVATVTDPNYVGSATGTLVISSVLSQTLDQLAGIAPGAAALPQSASLTATKLSIVLNFSKSHSDTLKLTATFSLPPGIQLAGLTTGIACDAFSDKLHLNAKGKVPTGNSAVHLKLTPSGAATLTYNIRNKDLATALAASGLTKTATPKSGEHRSLNVGLMLKTARGSVYFYTESLNVLYKVTGTIGKCSLK